MTDNSKRTGPAIEAHYQFLALLVPTIEKFPKNHKFTIGDRIESIALNVLEALIGATYTKERTQHLERLSQAFPRHLSHRPLHRNVVDRASRRSTDISPRPRNTQ